MQILVGRVKVMQIMHQTSITVPHAIMVHKIQVMVAFPLQGFLTVIYLEKHTLLVLL